MKCADHLNRNSRFAKCVRNSSEYALYGHYINISQDKSTPYPPTHINTSVQSFRVTCCRSTGHPIPAQTVQQSSQTNLAAFRRLHVDYTWVTAQQWSSDACCTLPEHVLSHRNCKALRRTPPSPFLGAQQHFEPHFGCILSVTCRLHFMGTTSHGCEMHHTLPCVSYYVGAY